MPSLYIAIKKLYFQQDRFDLSIPGYVVVSFATTIHIIDHNITQQLFTTIKILSS
jgi:hypothetical protein